MRNKLTSNIESMLLPAFERTAGKCLNLIRLLLTLYRAIVRSLAHLHSCEQDRGHFFYSVFGPHQ